MQLIAGRKKQASAFHSVSQNKKLKKEIRSSILVMTINAEVISFPLRGVLKQKSYQMLLISKNI